MTVLPGLLFCAVGPSACSPAVHYDVGAVVLEAPGEPAPGGPPLHAGQTLAAGAHVHAPPRNVVTLGLVPGTVVTLGAGGELRLDTLRIAKRGERMQGREVDLTLAAGELDLLIVAPEESAPTTVRLRTAAGEIVARPGCLAHVQTGASTVQVLCARGELKCAGEQLSAGQVREFPGEPAPRPVAGNVGAQLALITLLERGAQVQSLELQRQAQPPGWRAPSP